MGEQVIQATPVMWGFVGISLLVLAAGFSVLFSGWRKSGKFSWAGFVLTMFVAVLLYDLGLWQLTGKFDLLLLSIFRSLQTMTANRDFELPEMSGVSGFQLDLLSTYGTFLFIVAPVSIVTAALDYFSGIISELILRVRSLLADSFVFSRLDERTLDLAQDICDTYRDRGETGLKRPCIVFANCGEVNDELMAAAHRLRAHCQEENVGKMYGMCSGRTDCSIILVEEDDVLAISSARQLKEDAQNRRVIFGGGDTRIFVLTDFRDTEPLLFPEVLKEEEDSENITDAGRGKVLVRGIDLTRELVEQIILRYPLFLLSKPLPGVNVPMSGGPADGVRGVPDKCWYQVDERDVMMSRRRELYERSDRHVLVLGAGSMGTEFLSYALWASRMDGIHTRIDAIDNVENPARPGRPLAESRYAAEAPEIMGRRAEVMGAEGGDEPYDLAFSLVDAETDAYASFLAERAKTVSYVFVALGDDLRNARVAMRTRQILERELARNAGSRDEFIRASRPLVLAVIRDDDFAKTVERATCEGHLYDIVCVGNNSDVLSYKMLETTVGDRVTEYKRRSSRAGYTHVKYRLFSFAHNLLTDGNGLRGAFAHKPDDMAFDSLRATLGIGPDDMAYAELRKAFEEPLDDERILEILKQVDWTMDVFDFVLKEDEGKYEYIVKDGIKGWTLALMYQLYCTNGMTRALEETEGAEEHSREWLLRMEHDRWNAYIRTQGVESADLVTVGRIFATGQADAEKHRSNFAGLHPCLVSFDELAALEPQIRDLYQSYDEALDERGIEEGRNKKVHGECWARLLDDNYIGIKRPKYDKEE